MAARLPQAPAENVAAVYLNYPSNPAAVAVPDGAFEEAVAYAETTGAAVVHDFAYGDLVFDGREPRSFLATPGAKDVGVEMFSMSKSYGMAGWRVGFVVGNAEIVERINLLNDHCRVGIFRPIQEACIAALTGPQDSVAERRDTYQRRRDRAREALGPLTCEGTFYIWLELPPRASRRTSSSPSTGSRSRPARGSGQAAQARASLPRGQRRDPRSRAGTACSALELSVSGLSPARPISQGRVGALTKFSRVRCGSVGRRSRQGRLRPSVDLRALQLDDRRLVQVDRLDRDADLGDHGLAALGQRLFGGVAVSLLPRGNRLRSGCCPASIRLM